MVITPGQVKDVIDLARKAGVNLLFKGGPGIGKTQTVLSYAKEKEIPVIYTSWAGRDVVDIYGIPKIVDVGRVIEGKPGLKYATRFAQPDWLPVTFNNKTYIFNNDSLVEVDKPGIIVFDEVGQARPDLQAMLLQAFTERRVGSTEIPAGWTLVAITNRYEDAAGTYKFISPLLSRVSIYEVIADPEDFVKFALKNQDRIHPLVAAYIKAFNDALYDFKPQYVTAIRPYATPRTWEYLSRQLFTLERENKMDLLAKVVEATVGDVRFIEFYRDYKFFENLPELIKQGTLKNELKTASRRYALAVHIGELIAKYDQKNRELILTCLKALDDDASSYSVIYAYKKNKEKTKIFIDQNISRLDIGLKNFVLADIDF